MKQAQLANSREEPRILVYGQHCLCVYIRRVYWANTKYKSYTSVYTIQDTRLFVSLDFNVYTNHDVIENLYGSLEGQSRKVEYS
jgi:hypothetical protein